MPVVVSEDRKEIVFYRISLDEAHTEMSSQRSVRQHYVSQGFLRGFAARGEVSHNLIWVYEKLPARKPRKASIRSIAWEDSYYAQEYEGGSEDIDTVEKNFAHRAIPRESDWPLPLVW